MNSKAMIGVGGGTGGGGTGGGGTGGGGTGGGLVVAWWWWHWWWWHGRRFGTVWYIVPGVVEKIKGYF